MAGLFILGLFASVWLPGQASCPVGTSGRDLVEDRGYSLHGRTVVMTGGDGGVGSGVTEGLALSGAHLVLLAHNVTATEAIIRKLRTGRNTSFKVVPIDMLSLASVKEAAEKVLRATDRVDAVVSLAGVDTPILPAMTSDGFESAIQLEYIAHFFLTELLLPRLRSSQGRIVHVSTVGVDLEEMCSGCGQPFGCEAPDNLDAMVRTPNQRMDLLVNGNVNVGTYLKLMHARALARREAAHGVTAYSFNPGFVTSPHVQQRIQSIPRGADAADALCGPLMPWYWCLCRGPNGEKASHCPLMAGQGGVAGVYLTAAPKAELDAVNGELTVLCGEHPLGARINWHPSGYDGPMYHYFDPYDEMVAKDGLSATEAYLEKLYELSESWVSEAMQSKQPEKALGLFFALESMRCKRLEHAAGLLFALALAAAATLGVLRRRVDWGSSKDRLLMPEGDTTG